MSDACLAPYAASGARVPFEASGKFMTGAQAELVGAMLAQKRSAVQLNMGFGKSALVVPMLVLRYLETYRVVVVTQPAHLVAPALRIIGAAVAARPREIRRSELVTLPSFSPQVAAGSSRSA